MIVTTENGAGAYSSTSSRVLDLFFQINAMRDQKEESISSFFSKALDEDPLDAMRILFWSRDIRQGQGERRTFRILLNWLANNHPNILRKNLHLVGEFGRWDDIFSVFDTELEADALSIIRKELLENKNALLAKWTPRLGSSKHKIAEKIRAHLALDPKRYRKLLSGLTQVVETKMCAQEWGHINYEHVPSVAMKNYRKAFHRNDGQRFTKYLEDVQKGKKKINSGALYPHDIVNEVRKTWWSDTSLDSLQAQWDALPNYMTGNTKKLLPVADVSGSMTGLPMDVCIALSLYISERNEGPFKDHFITFSSDPQLQCITGKNLKERIQNLESSSWGMSTDLYKTFKLILNRAVQYNIPEEEMPDGIIIFSDMQFDQATHAPQRTIFQTIKSEYEKAGYKMPQITFWNLRAALSNVPVKMNEHGVALVSGFSPSLLKQLLTDGEFNPMRIMRNTIDSQRYQAVTI